MLGRYLGEEKNFIPYTDKRYVISANGLIRDVKSNLEINPDLANKVNIFILDEHRYVELAWLLMITFKPIYCAEDFVLNWRILYADKNKDNLSLENLIWKPPHNGQQCPENQDFNVIPHFSKYAISLDGRVFNRLTKSIIKTRREKAIGGNFYVRFSIWQDRFTLCHRNSCLAIHRALGLAYLDYDENVNNLTINHKDGNKSNNSIDNLEWLSYSLNNIHAMDKGLRNSRIQTLIYDCYIDKEILFESITKASEFIGVNSGVVYEHCFKSNKKPLLFRFLVKFLNDKTPWIFYSKKQLLKMEKDHYKKLYSLECVAKNIYTNEIFYAKGPGELGRLIGITKDQAKTALDSKYKWPAYNYVFSYLSDNYEFRSFSKDELELFKDKHGIIRPVKLTMKDGSVKLFVSVRECSFFLFGIRSRVLTDLIYQSGGKYICENFTLEYLK